MSLKNEIVSNIKKSDKGQGIADMVTSFRVVDLGFQFNRKILHENNRIVQLCCDHIVKKMLVCSRMKISSIMHLHEYNSNNFKFIHLFTMQCINKMLQALFVKGSV